MRKKVELDPTLITEKRGRSGSYNKPVPNGGGWHLGGL